MTRTARFLSAGLIAAASFVCLQHAAAPTAAMAASPNLASCDAKSFAEAVVKVRPGFDPSSTSDTPPAWIGPPELVSIPPNIRSDLFNAFDTAPPFFKQQLCEVTQVYLNPDPGGWGYRKFPTQETFIAIPLALWAGKSTAQGYYDFERDIARRLLKWAGVEAPADDMDPGRSSALTVLAALAHEYGHILWYRTFVKKPRGLPAFSQFCDGTFYDDSWDSINDEPPMRRFRKEGDISSKHFHVPGMDDLDDQQLQDSVPTGHHPDAATARRMLAQIYNPRPGRWASLYATFSAEEDFVETYKLFVLKNAKSPLQHAPIIFPVGNSTVTGDIPGTCSARPILRRKLGCFAQKFCNASPAADACMPLCANP